MPNKPTENQLICYECSQLFVFSRIEHTHQPKSGHCFKCGKPLMTDRVFIGDNDKWPEAKDSTAKEIFNHFIENLTREELITLRAIINGKLSRRTITKDQQDKMQEARTKK